MPGAYEAGLGRKAVAAFFYEQTSDSIPAKEKKIPHGPGI